MHYIHVHVFLGLSPTHTGTISTVYLDVPVWVTVAECLRGDLEGWPNRVQRVLYNLQIWYTSIVMVTTSKDTDEHHCKGAGCSVLDSRART